MLSGARAFRLNSRYAGFAQSEFGRLFHACHKDFAVPYFSGMGRLTDGVDHLADEGVVDHDDEMDLGHQVHLVLGAR